MNGKIKELTNIEDFKKVYMVFLGPPYNEKYTDEELEEIFNEYLENGYMYGAYLKDDCVGLIALERGAKKNQPVSFPEEEKIMYLADIAVLEERRRRGLGNQLMIYGVMQSKLLGYDRLYMRTLEKGSMSCSIAKKIGFEQIPNVYQDVERERVNGSIETMKNIFLEIDLRLLKKDILKQAIAISGKQIDETENERE